VTKARATSFSGLSDLRAYIKCRDAGGSPEHCLSVGDNGLGAFGQVMATLKVAYVALPRGVAVEGKMVTVTLNGMGHGNPFTCIVGDIAPAGVVDLNPGALIAAGLPSDTELDCPAQWDWA
jgi:hypothetical protein